MKNIFVVFSLFITISAGLLSCGESEPKGFLLEGHLDGAANLQAYLDETGINNRNNILQKTDVDGSGNFRIETQAPLNPGIYRVRVGAQRTYLILTGEHKVKMEGNLDGLNRGEVTISGSNISSDFNETLSKLSKNEMNTQQLADKLKDMDPLAAMTLARSVFRDDPGAMEIYQGIEERMSTTYPTLDFTNELKQTIAIMQQTLRQQQMAQKIKKGEVAPDNTDTALAAKMPEPIFDPTTKAEHDIPIDRQKAITMNLVSEKQYDWLATTSIQIYKDMSSIADKAGFILADLKLEFGILDGAITLGDSIGPDEYRLWPKDTYQKGKTQEAYDKQILRDWLTEHGYQKQFDDARDTGNEPVPPSIPDDIIKKMTSRYITAYQKIAGKTL